MSTDTETRLARLEGIVTAKITGNQDLKDRVSRLEEFALEVVRALEGFTPGSAVTDLNTALNGLRIANGKAGGDALVNRVDYLEEFAREFLHQLARITTESTVATLKEALGATLTARDRTPATPATGGTR